MYLTKCPHCGSTFKIDNQLLAAAGGHVRCGSCMAVFNAKEQLFPQEDLSYGPPRTTRQESSFIDRFGKQTDKTGQPEQMPNQSPAWETNLIDEKIISDTDDIVFEDDPEQDRQDKNYSGHAKKDPLGDDLSADFLELDSRRDQDTGKNPNKTIAVTEKTQPDDESWARKILEEELGSSEIVAEPVTYDQTSSEDEPGGNHVPSTDIALPDAANAASETLIHRQTALAYAQSDYTASDYTPLRNKSTRHTSETITAPVHSISENNFIAADPSASYSQYQTLQFDPIEARSGRRYTVVKKLLVGLLFLLLIAAIIGQFAWLHRAKLSLYPELRPAYTKACELLDCTLPDMVDLTKIKSQNLVVRSHPVTKNALLIDAVIVNKASFAQPFPDLELYFSDLNNNVVTKRTFTPGEYLVGEAAEYTMMPTMRPVHLAIEVKDPGSQAVNYSLDFQKANSVRQAIKPDK